MLLFKREVLFVTGSIWILFIYLKHNYHMTMGLCHLIILASYTNLRLGFICVLWEAYTKRVLQKCLFAWN